MASNEARAESAGATETRLAGRGGEGRGETGTQRGKKRARTAKPGRQHLRG
jgi:hypothetical protein